MIVPWKTRHRDKANDWQIKSRHKNRVRALLVAAKFRARKRKLPFDITEEDIAIPNFCPVLGIPLCSGNGKMHANSPTLERVDNTKGYTRNNVIVISQQANAIKSDLTIPRLRLVAVELQRKAENMTKVADFYEPLLSEGL